MIVGKEDQAFRQIQKREKQKRAQTQCREKTKKIERPDEPLDFIDDVEMSAEIGR